MAETLIKRSGETRTYAWEFSDFEEVAAGDPLSTLPSVVADQPGLGIGQPFIQGSQVRAAISGGADGTRYKLMATCRTQGGSTIQLPGILIVRDD